MKTDTQTAAEKAITNKENELQFGTGKTGFVDYPYVWQYELEQLQRQLEQKQAQADKLAEALRDMREGYQRMFDVMPVAWQTYDHIAESALAAYESEVQP